MNRSRILPAFLGVLYIVLNASAAQADAPTISAVVDAASYIGPPVSPGEMITIFGVGLGPSTSVGVMLDAPGHISSNVAGVQVFFGGTAAPLIYVSALQVNAMVPFEVAGSASTQVTVQYNGATSASFTIAVAPASPGIFSFDASGVAQGAILNQNNSKNSASNPAAAGSVIQMFVTGLGQTNPASSDGQIAAAGDTKQFQSAVAVRIGGINAQIQYSGPAPGNVYGFSQINAVIPTNVISGNAVPVWIATGNATSQTDITLAISGGTGAAYPAPSALQASATSSSQISLSWTSSQPPSSNILIERKSNLPAVYSLIAQVPSTQTTFADTGLAPNVAYTYRIRLQSDSGISPYSPEASATTPQAPAQPMTTVFLVHGLNQGSVDMGDFARNLSNPNSPDHVDLTRFKIDAGFDYSECTSNPSCGGNCTVQAGAKKLGDYIAAHSNGGKIILVAYSLGAIIAREAMLSDGVNVSELITLGSPNLGYPFDPIDAVGGTFFGFQIPGRCPTLVKQIASDLRTSPGQVLYPDNQYLPDLNTRWDHAVFSPPLNWLAISGTYCDQPKREVPPGTNEGCPDSNPNNDGVVCQVSAEDQTAASNRPTELYADKDFAHTNESLMCTIEQPLIGPHILYDPPQGSTLLGKVRDAIDSSQ